MSSLSSAQIALNKVLRQRLQIAGCQYGRLDISEPGACLSLSGQKTDGKTLFFWEFSCAFHQLVGDCLREQYDEHTAQLTILIDVVHDQFRYIQLPKVAPAAETALAKPLASEQPHDRTPYGSALAAQVAARLDQGTPLTYYHRDYCGMGLARSASGEYQYGEVWDGSLIPNKTLPTWASFVAWLAAQSDFSLAGLENQNSWLWNNQTITRQRLSQFVQSR